MAWVEEIRSSYAGSSTWLYEKRPHKGLNNWKMLCTVWTQGTMASANLASSRSMRSVWKLFLTPRCASSAHARQNRTVGRQRPPWLKLSLAVEPMMARTPEEEVILTWEASGNGVGRRLQSTNTEND